MQTEEIYKFLASPITISLEAAKKQAEDYLVMMLQYLQENQAARRELGPWIGKIKSLQKRLENLEQVDWVAVKGGFLAIGHRPGEKFMRDLQLQNATHIFTLLAESEGALKIKYATEKAGLEWVWYPMSHAEPPEGSRLEELINVFSVIKGLLSNGSRIYIHCSAGIHRTGMISLALLTYMGYDREQALDTLKTLRTVTSQNIGEHRQEWALSSF